jgi:murein DD-endopeptidase MepM/ murein hydrolase activator NlpD
MIKFQMGRFRTVESFKLNFFLLGALLVFGQGCSTARIVPPPVVSARHGFLDRFTHSIPLSREEKLQSSQASVNYSNNKSPSAFHWPLKSVEVTSFYGKRGRDFHEGIDLRAQYGTPVYAAQSGVVIYANSKIHGYGKMIVVRHWGQVATIYAHNSKLLVKRGQQVQQGQQISISGKSGHVTGPHLHFEIRQGVGSTDPLAYLPRRPSRQLASTATTPARFATAN